MAQKAEAILGGADPLAELKKLYNEAGWQVRLYAASVTCTNLHLITLEG